MQALRWPPRSSALLKLEARVSAASIVGDEGPILLAQEVRCTARRICAPESTKKAVSFAAEKAAGRTMGRSGELGLGGKVGVVAAA